MSRQDEVLLALKHTRHDWLNIIQLIKGNLALGHHKRIEDIIQQITQQAMMESKLFNIKVPELTLFLIGYNWTSQKVEMNYEVRGEEFSLDPWGVPLLTFVQSVTDKLSQSSSFTSENSLMVTFDFLEESCVLTCRYVGKTELKEADWQGIMKQVSDAGMKCTRLQQTEDECILTILIKET
ncbi:Spo0B domain-containing protein [Alkalicoccobacillus murimartini]|uniref:Stage 0 sporulation protein B (Sporulation initiation phosphotransferase) n=1 Tax=Alkalicoccobacillus murimartini TaxID=171685 RepID=A0ABT9YE72_9BACI|nr:Spo0B domain-containing protein [Alkalicoccobacillus murimartini]MDQ0205334.1 stage 0 sporulation protein B (sporulation initiation phosphotransferase) [Alkalicoccobacillus murimartini]